MNGFKLWALQDLSHMLPAKYLQHETHVSTGMKRRFWSLFSSSCKEKNESRRINSSRFSNSVKTIFTTQMLSSEITAIIFNTRSPMHFLNFLTSTTMEHPKASMDRNPAGDYDFIHGDGNVISDKIHYGACVSKIVSTLRESQEPVIDDTIEQVKTDNLSAVIVARNVDFLPFVKLESTTSEINQQQRSRDRFELPDDQHSQKYDISPRSPELQDYTHKDSVSDTTNRLEQQSRITRCISQTIISKPSLEPSSFEILEQSNMTKNTTEPSAILAEINTPRNISSRWSSMKRSCPRREYHTWKIRGIENDIKCHDSFASDIQTVQREQSARYGLSRFDGSTRSGSSGNQESRNLPSFVPRRDFSTKSCIVIQNSIRNMETLNKKLFSANLSIVRLRSHVSPTKPQQFSCDASKKCCEKNDGSKSQERSECKVESEDCGSCSRKVTKSRCRDKNEKKKRSQRKDACGQGQDSGVSSRHGTMCEKRQETESSDPCKHYICPELRIRKCNWEREPSPKETRRKCRAKDDARSKEPDCSRERDIDARCGQRRRSKSCTEREEPSRPVCSLKKSSKREIDCRSSKRNEKKRCEKKRPKCTGNNQRRSESCRKKNPSRGSDKNCGKTDGKRHYSQRSIFSVSPDHRSLSTLIPDIVARKTTKVLYSGYCKDEKKDLKRDLSCEKQKRKCETAKKDETKSKCVKSPAKCLSRKSIVDKMQTCQFTQRGKDEILREPAQKSCNHAEYCANRKIESITKDKREEKLAKEQPSINGKDKKPKEESMKEQIEREYKEIDECKKSRVKEKKEKKDEAAKKTSTEYKPTGLDRVISPCKQQETKDTKKFTSIPIISYSTDTAYKMPSIRSNIIDNEIPIISKNIKLLNVMFDRSFSTTKVSYQDDFAIERTTSHNKTVQNCSANNSDFIHGDELPNYIEVENDDEEEDDYDWIIGRPASTEIN